MNDNLSRGKEFLGAGIAFPFQLDGQGHLAINRLEDQVRQSILLILRTAKRERVMRPDFGSGLSNLVFAPASPTTAALAQHEVEQALTRFEPRIDLLNVKVTVDRQQQSVLRIEVEYQVRQTDAVFNLVYPFYLERGEL